MKVLIATVILLFQTGFLIAQRQSSYKYSQVQKVQFETCSQVKNLIKNPKINKLGRKLLIPVSSKSSKVFIDDTSDENWHTFEYLGDIKDAKFALVKRSDYNNEEFYLINKSTGTIDTLIGPPVFSQNMRDFACINNPGTDEKQLIQVCELNNGFVKTRFYIKGKGEMSLTGISCINRSSLLAKDNTGNYWKLNF